MSATAQYTGRFAPTPSGPLHFGSVISALASFLEARTHHGQWRIRIDDLDRPRLRQGAVDDIFRTLESLGMSWDGHVIYQSQRLPIYQAGLEQLMGQDMLYRCYCPRKLTRGAPYPGTCRHAHILPRRQYSIRLITGSTPVCFRDLIQGEVRHNINDQSGDFILKRSDGIFAYDLATALDDSCDGISHVIRGSDLLDSTPKQLYLQLLLGRESPVYGHIPIALNAQGTKISKRSGALDALLNSQPQKLLLDALEFLGQSVNQQLEKSDARTVIDWALEIWDFSKVPKRKSLPSGI